MTSDDRSVQSDSEDRDYSRIPADFPRPPYSSALPGAQPKFSATNYEGRYYPAGGTPPEIYGRWLHCEDLAQQFAASSLSTKAGKRAHMAEAGILDQYLARLIDARWTSEPEARWVIRRAAAIINWPVPPAAFEPASPNES